jgi:hypothetical protein
MQELPELILGLWMNRFEEEIGDWEKILNV